MKTVVIATLFCLAGPLFAAPAKEHLSARTAEDFAAKAAQVRNEMRHSGRFGGISSRDKDKVETELSRMERLLEQHGSVDDMGPQQREDLFNAQERANALLAGNDDQRMICEMVEPTGSKMRQRECRRAGEVRRTREAQRDGVREQTRHIMNGPKDSI